MKAAVYLRVSTQEQGDGWSLQSQYDSCREYAAERDWNVVRVYEDVHSGQDYDRPAFSRMLRLAKEGAFSRVLVWRMDRWGRDPAWNLLLERDLSERGIEIETVKNGPLGDTPEARLYRIVQYGVDLYEAEKTAQRCQEGRETAAEEGSWPGGKAPYGYDLDKEAKTLRVNEDEAGNVRRMYQLVLETDNTREVAEAVGVHRSTVQKRVRNAAYAGHLVYGDTVTRNAWPSIVPADLWEMANRALDERAAANGKEVSDYRKRQRQAVEA
jgi:site-specific DNA recombinase